MFLKGLLSKLTPGAAQPLADAAKATEPVEPAYPVFEIPPNLPNLKSQDPAALAAGPVSAEAKAMAATAKTPSEVLDKTLNEQKDPAGGVKMLAEGLPEKDAQKWAAQSAGVVHDKLPPEEKAALAAADAFNADPTPANQAAAAEAVKAAPGSGPGAWAAQAAAWSGTPLVATAVSGAVMLSALMDSPDLEKPEPEIPPPDAPEPAAEDLPEPAEPEPPEVCPEDNAKLAEATKPFIDSGVEFATF